MSIEVLKAAHKAIDADEQATLGSGGGKPFLGPTADHMKSIRAGYWTVTEHPVFPMRV